MKSTTLNRFLIVTLGGVALFATFQPQRAFGEDSPATEGKVIFQAKCSPCHTIGGGRLVGPDLEGVTTLRDHGWLERFISAPDRVLASGDPIANQLLKEYGGVAMPNLGLSHFQLDELIAYLAESAPRKKTAPPATLAEAAMGDPQRGAAFFTGAIPFQRGGAPCLACHTLNGVAPLGGGSLGPDLTGIYGRLGAVGLSTVLATLPFSTMRPIFQTRPLTQSERGDLMALFRVTTGRQPVDNAWHITLLAVAGLVLLLLLAGMVWRKRLKSVRRALVAAMAETGGDRR